VRYQQRAWSCGPAALVNAARSIGVRISEGRARKLAGTTEDGTDEDELIQAARGIGLTATPHHSKDQAAAWAFIRSNVLGGHPCLICIDQWTHWVTVVGIIGDRILLADPANTKKNAGENGLHSLSRTDLYKRWRCPNELEPFYAIAVGK
jgi:ABC-type bacteriocin/lantibiotic exporter with double-glycine peptidase domain